MEGIRQIKVLCQFVAQKQGVEGVEIQRDAIVIEVARSCMILEEFEVQLARRMARGYWNARPDQTRLVSYLPENGQRHFEAEVDRWQAPLH